MSENSLFILFGSALFMLIVSVLIFLRMGGIHIQIHLPEISIPSAYTVSSPSSSLSPYVFGGLAVGFIATYIAYKVGYV
jgi:hypothetical protein